MLTTARPIFEHVPATFADPVGLADQQAEGVVSLIVVRYPAHDADRPRPARRRPTTRSSPSAASSSPSPGPRPTTASRSRPPPRSPASSRTRDARTPRVLSLYELDETDCARFLETVFYASA